MCLKLKEVQLLRTNYKSIKMKMDNEISEKNILSIDLDIGSVQEETMMGKTLHERLLFTSQELFRKDQIRYA